MGNNSLSSLRAYTMTSASTPAQTPTTLSTSCVGTTCLVVKQIRLFFIKSGSSVALDNSSSYVVLGNTVVSSATYVYLKYSYQFIPQAAMFPYTANVGYVKNALLSLLKTSNSSYYRVFNPLNLAFIKPDATCRADAFSDADHSNLLSLRFGVNAIYSCLGSSTLLLNNLKQAFDMVGSIASASVLADYISIDYSAASSATNQNLQLLFYYSSIGTQSSPQYQITKAVLNPLSPAINGQYSLFV